MKTNSIIVDYGVGNLYSLKKAIEFTGHSVIISRKVEDISNATHIFLPGVGSFYKASETLKQMNLFNLLKNLDYRNKKIMGICLGMQLLFQSSNEDKFSEGLSLIKGKIEKIKFTNTNNNRIFKIPNIGWFKLKCNNDYQGEKIIKNLNFKNDKFYFVHSYHAKNFDLKTLIAHINYDDTLIPAIVKKGNIYGMQFHPEKSRAAGINLIKNFLS